MLNNGNQFELRDLCNKQNMCIERTLELLVIFKELYQIEDWYSWTIEDYVRPESGALEALIKKEYGRQPLYSHLPYSLHVPNDDKSIQWYDHIDFFIEICGKYDESRNEFNILVDIDRSRPFLHEKLLKIFKESLDHQNTFDAGYHPIEMAKWYIKLNQNIPRDSRKNNNTPFFFSPWHYKSHEVIDMYGGHAKLLKTPCYKVEEFGEGLIFELLPEPFDIHNLEHWKVQWECMRYLGYDDFPLYTGGPLE